MTYSVGDDQPDATEVRVRPAMQMALDLETMHEPYVRCAGPLGSRSRVLSDATPSLSIAESSHPVQDRTPARRAMARSGCGFRACLIAGPHRFTTCAPTLMAPDFRPRCPRHTAGAGHGLGGQPRTARRHTDSTLGRTSNYKSRWGRLNADRVTFCRLTAAEAPAQTEQALGRSRGGSIVVLVCGCRPVIV